MQSGLYSSVSAEFEQLIYLVLKLIFTAWFTVIVLNIQKSTKYFLRCLKELLSYYFFS